MQNAYNLDQVEHESIYDFAHQHLEKMNKKELFSMIFEDEVTKIPNRKFFNYYMNNQSENREEKKDNVKALFYIDLNKFKPVNDEYGHDVGDEMLQLVAKRLNKITRKEDKIMSIHKVFDEKSKSVACRLGGDEFVVYAVVKDEYSTNIVQRRIKRELERPYKTSAGTLIIGASVGVQIIEEDENWQDALKKADKEMYKSKEVNGR